MQSRSCHQDPRESIKGCNPGDRQNKRPCSWWQKCVTTLRNSSVEVGRHPLCETGLRYSFLYDAIIRVNNASQWPTPVRKRFFWIHRDLISQQLQTLTLIRPHRKQPLTNYIHWYCPIIHLIKEVNIGPVTIWSQCTCPLQDIPLSRGLRSFFFFKKKKKFLSKQCYI